MDLNEKRRIKYQNRKQLALQKLGGKCIKCGVTEKLEFDHKNPGTKVIEVGGFRDYSDKKFWEEVAKCQLLCEKCHEDKTIQDLGYQRAKGNHGTVSSYRYCKCDLCKAAKSKYSHEYAVKTGRYKGTKKVAIHGSSTMYCYHACRCELCRKAHSENCRKYILRKKQAAMV